MPDGTPHAPYIPLQQFLFWAVVATFILVVSPLQVAVVISSPAPCIESTAPVAQLNRAAGDRPRSMLRPAKGSRRRPVAASSASERAWAALEISSSRSRQGPSTCSGARTCGSGHSIWSYGGAAAWDWRAILSV